MKHNVLDRYCRGWTGRKYAKRQTSKARRRASKRDPENAGTRLKDYTSGWYG